MQDQDMLARLCRDTKEVALDENPKTGDNGSAVVNMGMDGSILWTYLQTKRWLFRVVGETLLVRLKKPPAPDYRWLQLERDFVEDRGREIVVTVPGAKVRKEQGRLIIEIPLE